MKINILKLVFIIVLCNSLSFSYAQDPNFSQFFSSPLTISPALTGYGESNWKVMSNIRNQWMGTGSTFRTKTLSADGKLFEDKQYNTVIGNYLGLGGMVLQDDAMDGAYRNTYFSLNTAYHVTFDRDGYHGLAVGLGWIYNKTIIDFSQLNFGEQLSSAGFNRTLPTAETNLTNIPAFSSFCAGLMYTFSNEYTSASIGVSGYRFIKSKRSVLKDDTQYDAPRYNVHADFDSYLNENTSFGFSGIYQTQNGISSTTVGGNIGFSHAENQFQDRVLNLGLFYRLGDAIIPYVGYVYNGVQLGISYDVTTSNLKSQSVTPNTLEFSLVFRHYKSETHKIPWLR